MSSKSQIRREASAATGLGDEVDLAIFVRDAGRVVAGITGWTWGDCSELQNLWVEPSLRPKGVVKWTVCEHPRAAASASAPSSSTARQQICRAALRRVPLVDISGRILLNSLKPGSSFRFVSVVTRVGPP